MRKKISGAKIYLPIEMNIESIFILTISLFVAIVSYFVFPDQISMAQHVTCTYSD